MGRRGRASRPSSSWPSTTCGEPEAYETFLRPILDRLKEIDGRAPVSIMTCQRRPRRPAAQALAQGRAEPRVHTLDHPCPLLQKGDFAEARGPSTSCVDLLATVPGNRPVAFRMPCCDSLNTPSPRFFAEIFNKTTPGGHFLTIDSSVFNVFTPDDPDLAPRARVDPDGRRAVPQVPARSRRSSTRSRTTPTPTSSAGSAGSSPASSRATGRPSTSTSRTTRAPSRT